MYIEVTFNRFCDAFQDMGREDQFSYEALKALFDYYEDLEESTNETIELDVIAICCDWTEYESEEELANDYGSLENVEANTTVIPIGEGFLVQNF